MSEGSLTDLLIRQTMPVHLKALVALLGIFGIWLEL
jgi:hypothetical protein